MALFRVGLFHTSGKMQVERELPSPLNLVGPAAPGLAELCLGEDCPSAHPEGELLGSENFPAPVRDLQTYFYLVVQFCLCNNNVLSVQSEINTEDIYLGNI